MKNGMAAGAALLMACGGPSAGGAPRGLSAGLEGDAGTASSAKLAEKEASGATAGGDAGKGSDAPKPPERPFAKTSAEATSLIDDAVNTRQKELGRCVISAQERRKNPHAIVSVEIGIDQEGSLIGVKTPKGAVADKALNDCVRDALHGAPFPRSKAGVITMKKTFSDILVDK